MIKKLDHIGVAVRDVNAVLAFYREALGLEALPTEVVEEQGVRVTSFRVGESNIELLEPLSPESPVARFMEKRGEGIHHIAVEVDSVQQTIDELQARGLKLIDRQPRRGAHNKLIAFVHPQSSGGVLMELSQPADEAES